MTILAYPICEKPSGKLSWTHYVELIKLDDPQERTIQALEENS